MPRRRSTSRSTTSTSRTRPSRSCSGRSARRPGAACASASLQRRRPAARRRFSAAASAEDETRRDRGAAHRDVRDPGLARPHASQVRRPRPCRRLDGLDELDRRLVVARGERDRRRRLDRDRGPLRRGLRAALAHEAGADARARSRLPLVDGVSRLVLAEARRNARAPDRRRNRVRRASRAHRVARDHLRPDPRHARGRRGRRRGRPRRRRRQHAGERGARTSGRRIRSRRGRHRPSGPPSPPHRSPASARRRTRPGAVHDFMHAKVTVCDDTAFVGSFNLSHSGERTPRTCSRSRTPRSRSDSRRTWTTCAHVIRRSSSDEAARAARADRVALDPGGAGATDSGRAALHGLPEDERLEQARRRVAGRCQLGRDHPLDRSVDRPAPRLRLGPLRGGTIGIPFRRRHEDGRRARA